MTHRSGSAGKWAVLVIAMAAAMAVPLSASARGWGGHGRHGGHHGAYHGGHYYGGHHYRGGHWSGGRWIAGAIVTGAVIGLVNEAVRPAPVYYDYGPRIYSPPHRVVRRYYGPPVVRERVIETRVVTRDNPYRTRYVRDDGYDGD